MAVAYPPAAQLKAVRLPSTSETGQSFFRDLVIASLFPTNNGVFKNEL
jgi:hypothetical protein